MALKDWKKIHSNIGVGYEKRINKKLLKIPQLRETWGDYIFIYTPDSEYAPYKDYVIVIRKGLKDVGKRQHFKTYPQALKFAKAYMRKH